MTDRELLIAYQQSSGERSKDLFGQLVARDINLVYSVAHRHVKESHAAQMSRRKGFSRFSAKPPRSIRKRPWAGCTSPPAFFHSRLSVPPNGVNVLNARSPCHRMPPLRPT